MDKLLCTSKTTIQIDSSYYTLHSIRYDRIPVSSACPLFSLAKEKIASEADLVRTQCQRRFTYNAGTEFCHFALSHIRVIVK